MSRAEYKTILLPYKPSTFQGDSPEIQDALNAQAADNWRLSQIVMPSTLWGRAGGVMAILERIVD